MFIPLLRRPCAGVRWIWSEWIGGQAIQISYEKKVEILHLQSTDLILKSSGGEYGTWKKE